MTLIDDGMLDPEFGSLEHLETLIDRLSGNDQRILTPEDEWTPYIPVASMTVTTDVVTVNRAGYRPEPPKHKPKYEPRIWGGEEIFFMSFPEPAWVVEEIIPAGFTLLAGPPKKGKSWLALELALAICSDGYFLGHKVTPGKVFYCALEDGQRRFRDRQHKQNWTAEAVKKLKVVFDSDFRGLFGNSSDRFATFARDAGYSLIVIDTLTRAFHVRDWNDQALVSRTVAPLQELASEGTTSVLVIDHHHKRGLLTGNDDPISDIIGSISKAAVADTILGLYKDQGKPGARLAITGRDIEEQMLDLRFDMASGSWQMADKVDTLTDTQRETIQAIQSLDGGATLQELVEITGRNKGNLFKELEKLLEKGCLIKEGSRWRVKD
ncbi:MAG: AAA family ATPase [Anaerolineales bacterium]|nr:AAA family ATPase [Anaerolineales bacterium]